jgi:hypothetical protein
MTGIQGKRLSELEIGRIKHLLADTDMAITDIATRMGCSKASIVAINRRFAIRQYNGKRSNWEMGSFHDVQAAAV